MSINTYKLEVSDHPHPGIFIIEFVFTSRGWIIKDKRSGAIHNCSPSARTVLKSIFKERCRHYPYDFFDAIQYLWEEINNGHFSAVKTEKCFEELSRWISGTNDSMTTFY